jgi:hypothetical protein
MTTCAYPNTNHAAYSLHWQYVQKPGHEANMYGFKSPEEAKPIVDVLVLSNDITYIMLQRAYKPSRRGRWQVTQKTIHDLRTISQGGQQRD